MSYATDSGFMFYFSPQPLPATLAALALGLVVSWKLIGVLKF